MQQFFSLSHMHRKWRISSRMSVPKISSVSGNLLQMTKLWVNLKSAILKCNAGIPKAVISELLAVFNLVVVG